MFGYDGFLYEVLQFSYKDNINLLFSRKKVLAALSFCEISVPLQPKRTKRCRVITILYKRVGKGSCHLSPTFALLQ